MKRYFLIILMTVGCLQIGMTQKKVSFEDLDEFNGVTHKRYEQTPFTGIGVGYYGNGKKFRQIPYKEGRASGLAQEWDIHGNLKAEAEYKMGARYGRETQYYDNGKKRLEVYYQNGKPNGTVTEWYDDGQAMSKGEVVNGEYSGEHTWWYPNGQTEQIIEYRNGVAEGKVEKWYDNGALRKSTAFEKGQPNGKSIEWYRNGQKMNEQDFVEGISHGAFKYWSKDGRLLERKDYEEGKAIRAEDYNSASLRIKGGYAYVFNLLNSNFVITMKGEKVEPVSAEGLAFFVDGSIVQYFSIPIADFKGETETISDEELWKRFIEDEKNRVEYQLDTTITINQKVFALADGRASGIFWSFDSPTEITKGKIKIVAEQYIALKVKNHIIQINGVVLNANNPEAVEKQLAKIMETLEIYDQPIDIINYTLEAMKQP
jgi:antitoxin component YwqK of YwqJK toxin-antitoxin module